ncbi:hypothetical protein B7494_g1459 [Chlorociboria aeruginascens]|nr:hypothetical protein B7494_g1459 [Chlorociboria aeruginascens]
MATALQSFRFTARSFKYSDSWERPSRDPKVLETIDNAEAAGAGSDLRKLEAQIPTAEELEDLNEAELTSMINRLKPDVPDRQRFRKINRNTFLNMGEPEPFEEENDVDEGDDLTSIGHGELEAHRELRHYARLAAWEMPLLSKLAKPFEPPTADMPLRFRHTSYMGEQHPAEKKVVLEFCPEDMPLTESQRNKLRKLVGPRLNPETDIIRMSSEQFETQTQNKRYLGELVETLLAEAKDDTDTFEDVPLDTRHCIIKQKPKFPKEWRITKERQAELETYRQNTLQHDEQQRITGGLIDGVKMIELALERSVRVSAPLPEMAMPPRARGRKMAIRR